MSPGTNYYDEPYTLTTQMINSNIKAMKYLSLGIFIIVNSVFTNKTFSQESRFFMPVEIQGAYKKGTRSYDGKSGHNYWQNTSDYDIKVTVVPSEKLVDAKERIVYHNNSPDDINKLVVRLYGDVYKKGNMRLRSIDERDINEGVQIREVNIDGISYDLEDPMSTKRIGTMIYFQLPKPLSSGSSLVFNVSWSQKIPMYTKMRTGVYDSTSLFIAYWYPQIAVYDDIFGWDESNYLGNTEFYNDLANFNVEISVPKNYVVWATGTLENAGEVLPKEIYEKYQLASTSEKETEILSESDIKKGFKSPLGTWHYTAKDVTDFSIAMSDKHIWNAVMPKIGDHKVFINSVCPVNTAKEASGHLNVESKAIRYFTTILPGIPFPYEAFTTIVNKEAEGMEYPMMANIATKNRVVTIHEIFHSYFPMYVRTNERLWAWMDEGWATFNTRLAMNELYGNTNSESEIFSIAPYSLGTIFDLPLITPSLFLNGRAYQSQSYQVPDLVYGILYQYLGKESFLNCYRTFIERWAKKSPTPYDFIYTFENISGEDLSWLWKPWFFEFGYADLAIKSFQNGVLIIENNGTKPIPTCVEIIYKNESIKQINENAYVWTDGRKQLKIVVPDFENVKLILVNKFLSDINQADNYYPYESYQFLNH